MYLSYLDSSIITPERIATRVKKLARYRAHVLSLRTEHDQSVPEYSLVHCATPELHDTIEAVKKQFKGIQHLVLVGIGGQNLGVEAIHTALGPTAVTYHSLDTIAPHQINKVLNGLSTIKNVKKLAVIISSKSGATAETLVNAGVLLGALEQRFGSNIYSQTIFIGSEGSDFFKTGKKMGVTLVDMPKIVGGRFSVTTEAGLVPLALLGHDTDAIIGGILDATSDEFESVVAENAARLTLYLDAGFRHYNFFAFEPRLASLGAWYRQLFAESIGKAADRAGKPFSKAFLPTISTPVELHSIGQLYMSGFPGVYTDFVTFDDDTMDFAVPKKGIAKSYGRHSAQEVATALYGGVMGAYQEKHLPYRSTIFEEALSYSLGLFVGMRMLETMYVAELFNLNAFDQPNVELYKTKTREILGL